MGSKGLGNSIVAQACGKCAEFHSFDWQVKPLGRRLTKAVSTMPVKLRS
jgi:hypothetical protein